ncbi:MAG: site-2 protease family protein [Candidatus Lokiarchaeota archaeon]|nr:site-2 protease family protein [Candidatus Lokiarchaeota archaeon]
MSLFDIILDFILNPWFILSLLFWVFVLLLVFLLRNKKEAYYLWFPLLVMFKTRKLNKFIMKISRKAPKFWKIFWTIGIFVSFGFTIYALYFFFTNFLNLIIRPSLEQAIFLLIPGVTIDLPLLFYLILPLLFILTTHELAHGISAGAEGVEVKSTGILGAGLFFVIGFGAFVEVDERELNSQKFHRNTRLRIAAAGTYVNGITAGIAFILLLSFPLLISPFYRQVTQVYSVLPEIEGGINEGNLGNGDVILAIKKKGTGDDEYVFLDSNAGRDLTNILNNRTSLQCSIGDNLTFRIYNPSIDNYSEKNVTLGPRYYLGILYEYISDTQLQITRIYSASESGNNYNKNLTVGLNITKINGVPINRISGETLEKALTEFNLNTINFSTDSETYILDVNTTGVKIGIGTYSYFMHKNDVAKFFTSFWPEFWLREIAWLFIIAFSITLFNMLPLPIFDGDRIVKELLNWGFGEEYKTTRKKKDKVRFKKDETDLNLSEYRVEKVDNVKIIIEEKSGVREQSEIILSEDKYNLIDKIGDGFKDTVVLNLPEQTTLEEGSLIEISYEYWYDEKRKVKNSILNIIRYFTLFIIAGNFILSFIKFGGIMFWI